MSSKVIAIDSSNNRFVLWVGWSDGKTNIVQGLYELNRLTEILNGSALCHLVVDTPTWNTISVDGQIQNMGGSFKDKSLTKCPIESVVENESFGVVLAALPWLTFHICDTF